MKSSFYETEVFDGETVYLPQPPEPLPVEQPSRVWRRSIHGLAAAVTLFAGSYLLPEKTAASTDVRGYAPVTERANQAREHERGIIDALIKLQDDWDGYGAPAPNSQSADLAKSAIDIASAEGLSFDRLAPAGEGGIGLCFIRGEKYADIECLNDGEIFSALSDGHGHRDVIQVQATASGLKKATRRIGEFLGT